MKQSPLLFKFLGVTLVAVNLFLAHSLVGPGGGVWSTLRLEERNGELTGAIGKLQRERVDISQRIRLLERDEAFRERVVREQTNFVRDDEIVYHITPSGNTTQHQARSDRSTP